MKLITFFFVTVITLSCCLEFYVSPTGSDSNTGTLSSPFATLNRARDAIRAVKNSTKPLPPTITVFVRGGTYTSKDYSSPLLTLTAEDSGTSTTQISYESYQNEKVSLSGGFRIDPASFKRFTPEIVVADLSKIPIDLGHLETGQLGNCNNAKSELYINGFRGILARWPNIDPNTGLWQWTQISSVKSNLSFVGTSERAARWVNEKDGWLHGYWKFDWADNLCKIDRIDTQTNTISIESATPPVYSLTAKARYFGVNLLSELDMPLEYYIDRTEKKLYFYCRDYPLPKDMVIILSAVRSIISISPTNEFIHPDKYFVADPPSKSMKLAGLERNLDPLPNVGILAATVSNIRINGFSVEYAQSIGISAQSVTNCTISNIMARNHGEFGISVTGYGNKVIGNNVTNIGCKGIAVEGGDYMSLTRGNNEVKYNTVYHYALWKRTYQPGIAFGGVGNEYSYNKLSDSPHQGMFGGGNDFLFKGNSFDNMCYEATDSGAWYSGRSWTHRGTIITQNTFTDIRNLEKTVLGAPSVQAVYLDDELSAHTIVNNTFIRCFAGILLGGGRRVEIHGNRFVGCGYALHFDNRGMNWQKEFCQPGGQFEQQLKAVHYQQPPYSTHYPHIVNIMQDHPCVPVHNNVSYNEYCCPKVNNVSKSCGWSTTSSATAKSWMSYMENNNANNWSPMCV